ncbi:MAG TPA: hypothetical protein VFN10_15095 [Thermoanaerobaculia bacterium]|nr:hypothetical protein [Thermoanaerobaculia bacterium]
MSRYPLAERASVANAASAVSCVHCHKAITVSTWDRFNGFLVECPHCHGFHGRRWQIRAVAFASFLLNAASFLFTMRPGKALLAMAAWVGFFWFALPRSDGWPEAVRVMIYGALMIGPMLINAILLVRHQIDLDRAPVVAPTPASRARTLPNAAS